MDPSTSPPCILINRLIFKIYRNVLTAKVSEHFHDSNTGQHKDVYVPFPKGFLLPFKSLLKFPLEVDMPCIEGHPNKIFSKNKNKKFKIPQYHHKKTLPPSPEIQRNGTLEKTLKAITDGSQTLTHGVVFHWSK